jgi:2-haloacid dehalogenase
MSDTSAVKALVFDVFGTVVDWRTSLIADFTKWSETRGIKADWTALSMAGAPSMPHRWMR